MTIILSQTLAAGGAGDSFTPQAGWPMTFMVSTLTGTFIVESNSGAGWVAVPSATLSAPGQLVVTATQGGVSYRANQTSGTGAVYKVDGKTSTSTDGSALMLGQLLSVGGDPTVARDAAEDTVLATIGGKTPASTLSLADTYGGAFKMVGNVLKVGAGVKYPGIFPVTIVETLAGAVNSPKSYVIQVMVTATLSNLTLSGINVFANDPPGTRLATLVGKTPGSELSLLRGDGSVILRGDDNSGWSLVKGSNPPSLLSLPVNIVEQLRGPVSGYRQTIMQVSNTFVHMGDSRVQGMFLDSNKRNKSTNNQWNWANRSLGNRLVVLGNFGVAGQTSIQQLAYIDQAIATGAGNYSLQVGVNDFTANIPTGTPAYPGDQLNTTWGAVWYMLERARTVGMRVWAWLDPGSSNQNATQLGLRDALNAKLRDYAAQYPTQVVLVDLPTWALTNPGASTVVWKTDGAGDIVSNDGTHLTTVGGRFIGVENLAPLVNQVISPTAAPNITSAFATGSLILTPNPLFGTLTGGGSAGSGNSGTLPGSVSGSRIGGSVAAFSNTPSASGSGNDLIMTVTNTGSVANDRARFSMNLNTAAVSGGYWLQVGMEIDVDAGARGIQSVTLGTNFSVNAVQNFNNDAISDATRLGDRGGYTAIQLQTDRLYISGPASATPSFFLTAYAFPGENGTATITARKPWARVWTTGIYPP